MNRLDKNTKNYYQKENFTYQLCNVIEGLWGQEIAAIS
jgi:hypothetical protein